MIQNDKTSDRRKKTLPNSNGRANYSQPFGINYDDDDELWFLQINENNDSD